MSQVILCKDSQGKVGLRVRSINKGVFVCLVMKGSPAAQGGLRFGDQILQVHSSLLPKCFKIAHECCLSVDQF
jgi:syntenin-1